MEVEEVHPYTDVASVDQEPILVVAIQSFFHEAH